MSGVWAYLLSEKSSNPQPLDPIASARQALERGEMDRAYALADERWAAGERDKDLGELYRRWAVRGAEFASIDDPRQLEQVAEAASRGLELGIGDETLENLFVRAAVLLMDSPSRDATRVLPVQALERLHRRFDARRSVAAPGIEARLAAEGLDAGVLTDFPFGAEDRGSDRRVAFLRYLSEMMALHRLARQASGLEPGQSASPVEIADQVFRWVVERLPVNPTLTVSDDAPCFPLGALLGGEVAPRRKAWAFVALLQQLDVAAFLVMAPGLGEGLAAVAIRPGELLYYDLVQGIPLARTAWQGRIVESSAPPEGSDEAPAEIALEIEGARHAGMSIGALWHPEPDLSVRIDARSDHEAVSPDRERWRVTARALNAAAQRRWARFRVGSRLWRYHASEGWDFEASPREMPGQEGYLHLSGPITLLIVGSPLGFSKAMRVLDRLMNPSAAQRAQWGSPRLEHDIEGAAAALGASTPEPSFPLRLADQRTVDLWTLPFSRWQRVTEQAGDDDQPESASDSAKTAIERAFLVPRLLRLGLDRRFRPGRAVEAFDTLARTGTLPEAFRHGGWNETLAAQMLDADTRRRLQPWAHWEAALAARVVARADLTLEHLSLALTGTALESALGRAVRLLLAMDLARHGAAWLWQGLGTAALETAPAAQSGDGDDPHALLQRHLGANATPWLARLAKVLAEEEAGRDAEAQRLVAREVARLRADTVELAVSRVDSLLDDLAAGVVPGPGKPPLTLRAAWLSEGYLNVHSARGP